MKKEENPFLIDSAPDTQWKHISSNQHNLFYIQDAYWNVLSHVFAAV